MKKPLLYDALAISSLLIAPQAESKNKHNLVKGYEKFFNHYFKQHPTLYKQLALGQHPHTLFLACCDSRIDPVLLTSGEPGDLFVIRNIANYVPSFVSRVAESEAMTALDFAVHNLPIQHIIVLGHQHCSGVQAIALAKDKASMPLAWQEEHDRLHEAIQQEYSATTAELFEKENIKLACQDLLTYPFIKERIEQGKLRIQGWCFYLDTGTIQVYDPILQKSKPLI
jgi:carbonic anhydrase